MKEIHVDLKAIALGKGAKIPEDLNVSWVDEVKGKSAFKVQPTKDEFCEEDDWVLLLENIEFTEGVIEFDALGQSEPRQSNFLGAAFHYIDTQTHGAVYFRPFNFRAEDADRKIHAVQYISHPEYRWANLRREKPGQYEKGIFPAPDGDAWFHVRIVAANSRVSASVNGSSDPCLEVNELSSRKGGGVGLWVGPGQGGYFANLRITCLR
jgi:hypothetical protein